jgi:hypothetical protein
MNNNKNQNRYFRFVIGFLSMFLIFQLIGNFAFYMKERFDTEDNAKLQKLTYRDHTKEEENFEDEEQYIVIGNSNSLFVEEVITKALDCSKNTYKVCKDFKEITEAIPSTLKAVFVCDSKGDLFKQKAYMKILLNQGTHIVFLQLPDLSVIEENDMYDILGIDDNISFIKQKGIRFVSDFLLGGIQDYEDLICDIAWVKLRATCKTYAYGLNQNTDNDIANEDLPPIVWRNSYSNGQIFVINGPFINQSFGYGIILGILAQMQEDYLYPIVNGLTLVLEDFPYLENVNEQELQRRYNHNALGLQQDILIPSLISISKKYDMKPEFAMISDVDTIKGDRLKKTIQYYIREIKALNGEIGTMINGVPTYGETQIVEWDKAAYFGQYNEKKTIIPVIVDGVEFTDKERLSYYSIMTSLGLITQKIDMSDILYPEGDQDDWVNISAKLETQIHRYRDEFSPIASLNITEMTNHIKNFQMIKPRIHYDDNVIKVQMDQLYGTGYFILRTSKDIGNIVGGKYKVIEENAYLIEADKNEMVIKLVAD